MNCDNPLRTATEQGAGISVLDGRLIITAPKPLPDELIADIRAMRVGIIEWWQERAAIYETDGGYGRGEAESLASKDLASVNFSCRR